MSFRQRPLIVLQKVIYFMSKKMTKQGVKILTSRGGDGLVEILTFSRQGMVEFQILAGKDLSPRTYILGQSWVPWIKKVFHITHIVYGWPKVQKLNTLLRQFKYHEGQLNNSNFTTA